MKMTKLTLTSVLAVAMAAAWAVADGPGGDRPEGPPRGRDGRPADRQGPPRRGGPDGAHFRPPMPPLLRALDADKDGELSPSEIENAATALKSLDKNDDGKLTREELRPPHAGPPRGPEGGDRPGRRPGEGRDGDRPRRPEGSDRPGRGPGEGRDGDRPRRPEGAGEGRGRPDGGERGPGAGAFIDRVFENDKNEDGKLTKDEMPERGQRLFEHADANDDGAIDRKELEQAFKNMRDRRAGPGGGPPRGGEGDREGRPDRPRRPEST